MLKNYFFHPTIISLFILFFISLTFLLHADLLPHYFLLLFLPIPIAPFYEWLMHKFVLHQPFPKNNKFWRKQIARLHHAHHYEPRSIPLLFAPAWAVLIHLLVTYFLFSILTLSFTLAWIPFTSAVAYYLWYEWVHLSHHTPKYQPKTAWGKRLKQAHMNHHYWNENYYWGITNTFADKCLGTLPSRSTLAKSETVHHISGYDGNS